MGTIAQALPKIFSDFQEDISRLETSKRAAELHLSALSVDRDKVVAELQAAQTKLAGVRQQQKDADALAAKTVAVATARASELTAAASAEAKAMVAAARAKVSAALKHLDAA
jgi:hypothetical protein